jgi:hypothetical protein
MAHVDARERKWRGNWRMEWVASTLHTTSQHGVSTITTADAHTSTASSRLNWRPRQFKWTRLFRRKTKSGVRACAITFQTLRSQWPRGLRRRSTAAWLLRSWVWIPPGHGCLSVVSVLCCQVEVSATSWPLFQRRPTACGASLCYRNLVNEEPNINQ